MEPDIIYEVQLRVHLHKRIHKLKQMLANFFLTSGLSTMLNLVIAKYIRMAFYKWSSSVCKLLFFFISIVGKQIDMQRTAYSYRYVAHGDQYSAQG